MSVRYSDARNTRPIYPQDTTRLNQKNTSSSKSEVSFCKGITQILCYPAFWLVILVLAFILSTYFIILSKDRWERSQLKNQSENNPEASQPPAQSKALFNSSSIFIHMSPGQSHKLNADTEQAQWPNEEQFRHRLHSSI